MMELDCTTYAEHLLALSRTLKSEAQSFEHYAKELNPFGIKYHGVVIQVDFTILVNGFTIM